jgi:hypothetical protein
VDQVRLALRTAETNGISHFVEHMLFKGTRSRSAQHIAREMDSIGGNLDAFTSKETICFNVKSLADHVPIALDVLTDLVLNPVFALPDIERERGVILEEIKIDEDNPDVLVHELFTQSFWKGIRWASRSWAPRRRGAAGPAAALRLPRRPFSRREHGVLRGRKPGSRPVHRGRGGKVFGLAGGATLHELSAPSQRPHHSAQQEVAGAGADLPGRARAADHRRNRYATLILNTVLGGGMSSRLFQTIREERGLAYSIYSDLSPYRDTGNAVRVRGHLGGQGAGGGGPDLAEFRKLKQTPIGAPRLTRAKDQLKGNICWAWKLEQRAWRTWRGRRCTSTSSFGGRDHRAHRRGGSGTGAGDGAAAV